MTMQRFGVQLRAAMDGNTLVGHGAVFGQTARIGGTWERLAPSAFDDVLADPATDVRALINHDPQFLLGRQSAGTLRLNVDNDGLAFEVDLPDTSYANDLRALVERGDLDGASFGFVPGDDMFDRAPDGRQRRTHTNVSALVDVSAVTFPAYEGAGVALRSVEFADVGSKRTRLIRARRLALG